MNIQGFIKEIGEPRSWKTSEGKEMNSYPVVIEVPYIGKDGKERADEVIADHVIGNPEYLAKLEQARQNRQRLEFSIGFNVREWQGKKFQNAKMFNVQIMM